MYIADCFKYALFKRGHKRIIVIERQRPVGNVYSCLAYRKFKKHKLKYMAYILAVQIKSVDKCNRRIVSRLKLVTERLCFRIFGVCGIEEYDKRFSERAELCRDPAFCFFIGGSRQIGNTAVCGNKYPYCRVIGNYLPCSGLCRLFKRHLVFGPRSHHHSCLTVLGLPEGSVHEISDAIDHFYRKARHFIDHHRHGVIGYKFRLGRHYRLPCRRLRHFILCPFSVIIVGNVRKHERFHEFFDECGFSRSHGTYDSYVYIASRASGNILIYACIRH